MQGVTKSCHTRREKNCSGDPCRSFPNMTKVDSIVNSAAMNIKVHVSYNYGFLWVYAQ